MAEILQKNNYKVRDVEDNIPRTNPDGMYTHTPKGFTMSSMFISINRMVLVMLIRGSSFSFLSN